LALSFNVSRDSGTQSALLRADSWMIHLLGSNQAGLADNFARPDGDRFTPDQGWDVLPTGEPYLPAAPYALRTRPLELVRVGGSTIVAAEVLAIVKGPANEALLYHDRNFLGVAADRSVG